MDRIETNNVFRVAYHLTRPAKDVSLSIDDKGEKRFIVEGDALYLDDLNYHAGKALVNPLVFERLCRYLDDSGCRDALRSQLKQGDVFNDADCVDENDFDLFTDDDAESEES